MKTSRHFKFILSLFLTGFVGLSVISCGPPDQVAPGENYCSSGQSVLNIDDSNVSQEVKNKIYNPHSGSFIVRKGTANYNAQGRVVIIPITFTDLPMNNALSMDTLVQNFFSTGTGSVRDYFAENSWGEYPIRNAGVSTWTALGNTMASFGVGQTGNDWTRNPNVARTACQNSNINWANVDVNGDRNITRSEALICFLVPAGGGGACRPSSISITYNGQNYNISNSFVFFDCKRDDDLTKGTNDIRYNYSTIWHEMAHGLFSLPDRYQNGTCGTGPAGQYDIMSDNCSKRHMSIYDKMRIGWISPKVLLPANQRIGGERKCYNFPPVEQTPAALVLFSPANPDEFWIVENKNKSASARNFEADLPESGLAIWWARTNDDNSPTLIQFNDPTKIPTEYNNPAAGALFKYNASQPANAGPLLFTSDNKFPFMVRAISPQTPGMNAEF